MEFNISFKEFFKEHEYTYDYLKASEEEATNMVIDLLKKMNYIK